MLKPFIKWAGSKRWLAAQLSKEIEAVDPKLYIEPFVGGGAVALSIRNSISKILADTNSTLIDTWHCFQKAPTALVDELGKAEKQYGDNNEGYHRARDEMNSIILKTRRTLWIRRSALFLYLNARSFNGLWRTNQTGYMNVPFGKRESPTTIDGEYAGQLSLWLSNVMFKAEDFRAVLEIPKHDTRRRAVYFDPPYDQTFDGYAADGFSEADQRDLAEWFFYLVRNGAKVWATNSDTPLIRELYANARIESINEMHLIGATGDRRGKRACLLIRGG